MKTLNILWLSILTSLFYLTNIYGQTPIIYTDVIQVDSVTKDELYNRAKLWFATTYNSANDVLQIDDKAEGQIVGKAIVMYNPTILSASNQTKGPIKYTIKLFLKEGRYKYELSDFIHDPYGNQYGKISMGTITTDEICPNPTRTMTKRWNNDVWEEIKNQIEKNINSIIESLKQAMITPTESKNDNW